MHKQNPVFIIFVSSRVVCKFWKTSAKKPGLEFMAAAQDHMVARHGRWSTEYFENPPPPTPKLRRQLQIS